MLIPDVLLLWAFTTVSNLVHARDTDDIGFFWQLTDLHLDLQYNKTTKCRGRYGSPHCDSPWELVQSAINVTQTLLLNETGRQVPDFVIWSGDNGPHTRGFTKDNLIHNVQLVSEQIQRVFKVDQVYVLPVLGNHDVNPANQMRPDSNDSDRLAWCHKLGNDPLLWGPWIQLANRTSFVGSTSQTTPQRVLSLPPAADFSKGCFFSHLLHLPTSDLLLISVNGLIWYRENPLANNSGPDPLHQLQWLEQTFIWARKSNVKILLVSHFPPGASENTPHRFKFLQPEINAHFVQLLRTNADILMACLFAHIHVDSFRVLSSQDDQPVLSIFIGPSISPMRLPDLGSFNPRIRLYRYRRSSTTLLGYRQYFLNITQSNPQWQLEYDTMDAYNLTDLSPVALTQLLNEFQRDDTPDGVWSRYWSHELGGQIHETGPCPQAHSVCRCEHLCPMRHLDLDAIDRCLRSCTVGRLIYSVAPASKNTSVNTSESSNSSVIDEARSNGSRNTGDSNGSQHSSLPIIIGVIIGFLVILLGVVLIVNREICRNRGHYARRLVGPGGTMGGVLFTTVNGNHPVSLNGSAGGGGIMSDFDPCNSLEGSSTELRMAFHPRYAIADDHSVSTVNTADGTMNTSYGLTAKSFKSPVKPNMLGNCEYTTISSFVNEVSNGHSALAPSDLAKAHRTRRPNGIFPLAVLSPSNRHSHPPQFLYPTHNFTVPNHSQQFDGSQSTTREGDSIPCQLVPPSCLVCPTEDYYADDEEGPEHIQDEEPGSQSFSDDDASFDDGNKPFRLDRPRASLVKSKPPRDWKFRRRQSMQSCEEPLSPHKHSRVARGSVPNVRHNHSANSNGITTNSVPNSNPDTPTTPVSHNGLTNGQSHRVQQQTASGFDPVIEPKMTGSQQSKVHDNEKGLTRGQGSYDYVRI